MARGDRAAQKRFKKRPLSDRERERNFKRAQRRKAR